MPDAAPHRWTGRAGAFAARAAVRAVLCTPVMLTQGSGARQRHSCRVEARCCVAVEYRAPSAAPVGGWLHLPIAMRQQDE